MLSQSDVNSFVDLIRAGMGLPVRRIRSKVRAPRHARKRMGATPRVYAHPSRLAHAHRDAHEYA